MFKSLRLRFNVRNTILLALNCLALLIVPNCGFAVRMTFVGCLALFGVYWLAEGIWKVKHAYYPCPLPDRTIMIPYACTRSEGYIEATAGVVVFLTMTWIMWYALTH